jgi:hypothetical protein
MKEKNLQGKRYIALVRCSSAAQSDTSIDAQNAIVAAFARENGMVCVGTVELAGVSGSVPGIRTDIDQLIERKRQQEDFDVVLLQDATRFTRSGPAHGMKLLYDLRAAGLEVVFVKDDLPAGDLGDVMRGLQFFSGKEQARSIAHAVARGASFSLKEGRSAHCKAPPYGVDRLYTTADGEPKHVIRNLVDGTQVKLDPKTGVIVERFGRNEKTGVPAHYLKQKTERIILVPGDPKHVKIVREIFERHHRDGWGYPRIARCLNDRGVPSPRGGLWYTVTVRGILLNPVYLGTGLANVFSTAIYYMRGSDGPVESDVQATQLSSGRPPRRTRPRTDWVKRNEPHLTRLLNESVKTAAAEEQQARLDALAARQPQPRNRDRHRDSEFILKNILVSRQGGYPMTGRRTGKATCRKRYYAVSRAFSAPTSNATLRRLIPAEPLEAAVIAALQLILTEGDQIRRRLTDIFRRELRAARQPSGDVAAFETEQAKIEQQMSFALEELDTVGRAALSRKMKALQARLKEIQEQVRRAKTATPAVENADAIVDVICDRLAKLGQELPTLPPAALRTVLRQFVAKLVVDLETRDVEVEFGVPDWSGVDLKAVCLDDGLVYKTDIQAHPLLTIRRRIGLWKGRPVGIYDFAA